MSVLRRLLPFAPLALLAALAVALALGLTRNPERIPSVLIDKPLPEFALKPVRAGEPGFTSADLKGQVTLLNVWGSWCVTCRVEHPVLMEMARDGAIIYGLDWKDTPEAGAAWLAQNGDPYARVGGDEDGRVALDLGVTGAPETYVIDKQGRIAYKHTGAISRQDWRATLAPLVRKLEAQP